jgi:hypothetical protein
MVMRPVGLKKMNTAVEFEVTCSSAAVRRSRRAQRGGYTEWGDNTILFQG